VQVSAIVPHYKQFYLVQAVHPAIEGVPNPVLQLRQNIELQVAQFDSQATHTLFVFKLYPVTQVLHIIGLMQVAQVLGQATQYPARSKANPVKHVRQLLLTLAIRY
jgi:hypothetical protein